MNFFIVYDCFARGAIKPFFLLHLVSLHSSSSVRTVFQRIVVFLLTLPRTFCRHAIVYWQTKANKATPEIQSRSLRTLEDPCCEWMTFDFYFYCWDYSWEKYYNTKRRIKTHTNKHENWFKLFYKLNTNVRYECTVDMNEWNGFEWANEHVQETSTVIAKGYAQSF